MIKIFYVTLVFIRFFKILDTAVSIPKLIDKGRYKKEQIYSTIFFLCSLITPKSSSEQN